MNLPFENSLGKYRDTCFDESKPRMIEDGNVYYYGTSINSYEYKLIEIFTTHTYDVEYLIEGKCDRMVTELKEEYDKNGQHINISFNDNELLQRAVLFGEMDVAQWILSIQPNISFKMFRKKLFYQLCKKGHYEMFVWMFNQTLGPWNLAEIQMLFYESAQHCHLKIASWLLNQFREINTYISLADIEFIISEKMCDRFACQYSDSEFDVEELVQCEMNNKKRYLQDATQYCKIKYNDENKMKGFYVI